MDLGFVVRGTPGGEGSGAVQSATRLIIGLVEFGHDVTIYSTESPADWLVSGRDVDHESLELGDGAMTETGKIIRAIESVRDRLRSHDLIHFYHPSDVDSAARLGRTGVPTIVTLQAYGGVCPKNDLRFLDRRSCSGNGYVKCALCGMATTNHEERSFGAIKHALKRGVGHSIDVRTRRSAEGRLDAIEAFHTYANHVKDRYAEFGFPETDISVVESILDDNFLVPHESEFEEPYRLLYAGRLSSEKGVQFLVPILSRLQDSEYDFELTIAGSGSMEKTIESQIVSSGYEGRASVLGHVPYRRMPELYASHDVFLSPGIWEEPFGRVFIEAIATGTPVVATDVGAVDDILRDCGVVAEPSPDELAEKVLSLVQDDRLRRMSENGNERIRDFRPETIVPKMEGFYQQAIRGG